MIIATAGHIDHGKTTLVRALTGVDTDRLPQEKTRGISIDIGFAYWRAPGGALVGFVDVPGHERFVGNMLAGICCVDFALVVVAADDGVMPQTREHLNIVDLLGVRHGLVALTKVDRVDAARRQAAQREVERLLEGTSLQGARVLPVCAATGEGMDALRAALATSAAAFSRKATEGRRPRYAVDRSFTITGSGTVVTGTVVDGSIRTGDRLMLSPSGREVRIRGIQKDGEKAERAQAGERCALNLSGIERSQVRRGDWVVHPEQHVATLRMDVDLRVLDSENQALRHWAPVHVHLGTRDVTARVSLRRGEALAPGSRGHARLVLDQPIAAARGDRFILRNQSAQTTVGGGRVLDAAPAARRPSQARHLPQLQALAQPDPADALRALVACSSSGVNASAFRRNFNIDTQAFASLLRQTGLCSEGHGDQMRVITPEQARLASKAPAVAPENPEHVRLWQLAEPVLRRAGLAGITVPRLAEAIGAKEAVLRDAMHRKAQAGGAVRVSDDRFYLRATMDDFVHVVRQVTRATPHRRFTAGQFRDHAGVGRALAVQVLEALDRLGVTQRVANERVLREPALSRPPNPPSKEKHSHE